MSLSGLIGETVLDGDLAEVAVSSFEKEGAVVGLYFSAHWCPPCRSFTPILAEWYKKFKAGPNGDKFDIVFVSSDREEKTWKEYFGEMPWKALPYANRDMKAALSKKFKVSGIPTLLFLKASSGALITADGRSIVMEDSEGKEFPWTPKPFSEHMGTGPFVNKDGEKKTWADMKGSTIGVYFSAHWCGPCRAFTPQLVTTYNKLKEDGKNFEVIFVSSDREEDSWKEYLSSMPWYSLPFGDDRKKSLSRRFDVSGIPTLVILDDNGDVITRNGRGAVNLDPEGKDFPWHPKPVLPLTDETAGDLNDTASLIWFVAQDSLEKTTAALEPVAKSYIAKCSEEKTDVEMLFFVSPSKDDGDDDIRDSLRTFANIASDEPKLVIVDIPDQKVYEAESSDITEDNVKAFFAAYFDKSLKSRPLQR